MASPLWKAAANEAEGTKQEAGPLLLNPAAAAAVTGGRASTTPSTAAVTAAAAVATVAVATAAAAALVVPPRLRGGSSSSSAATDTSSSLPSLPPLPTPQPGDLVAWLPPPSLVLPAQPKQQQPQEPQQPQEQQPQPPLVVPPPVALDPPPSFWEQAFMLSRYTPRLSTASGGGHDGDGGDAPSYAAAVPAAALGVVGFEGKWLFYSGDPDEEGGGTVYVADMPMCRRTQGALLVLRAAAGGGATPAAVLGRAMAYRGARYEMVANQEEEEEEGTSSHSSGRALFALLAQAAGREGNARYACWATSVAGAHLRTPIERGPLTHHAVDTGEGTVVHYSGGVIRLDPLFVLLAGREGLAPHRLVTVNGASLARLTEEEVLGCLARLTSRLGERRYCVLTNNCETLSAWATRCGHPPNATTRLLPRHQQPHCQQQPQQHDPLPPLSSQVQAASLAIGSVVGGLGAVLLGAATAPALALPVMAVSGAAMGSLATYTAVARVAGAAQRELRAWHQLQQLQLQQQGAGAGVLSEVEEEEAARSEEEGDAKNEEEEEDTGGFVLVGAAEADEGGLAVE